MGNPAHAEELVKAYQAQNEGANKEDLSRWQELLQTKQDAIKGAMQQAMQAGDMRTIVQKKWADQLMEIEHAKAQLSGQLKLAGVKGENSARNAEIRGRWALEAVKQRTGAMLQAVGMKSGSAEYRSALDSATRRVNVRINKGQDAETAYQDVMDEMHAEYDDRVHTTHGGSVEPPAPEGAAPASAAPLNPLEAAAARRRAAQGKK